MLKKLVLILSITACFLGAGHHAVTTVDYEKSILVMERRLRDAEAIHKEEIAAFQKRVEKAEGELAAANLRIDFLQRENTRYKIAALTEAAALVPVDGSLCVAGDPRATTVVEAVMLHPPEGEVGKRALVCAAGREVTARLTLKNGTGPTLLIRSDAPFIMNGIPVGDASVCRDGSLGKAWCGLFDLAAMEREDGKKNLKTRIVPTSNKQFFLYSTLRKAGR